MGYNKTHISFILVFVLTFGVIGTSVIYNLREPNNQQNYELNVANARNIEVTNPTSSCKWEELNSYMITWTNETPVEQVDVGLYKGTYEEAHFLGYMEYGVENTGSYNWTLGVYEDGSDFYINVSEYGNSSNYGVSDYFTITKWEDNEDYGIPGFNVYIITTLIVGFIGASGLLLYRKRNH